MSCCQDNSYRLPARRKGWLLKTTILFVFLTELFLYQSPFFQIYCGSFSVALMKSIGFLVLFTFFIKSINFTRSAQPLVVYGYLFLLLLMAPGAFINGQEGLEQWIKTVIRLLYLPIVIFLVAKVGVGRTSNFFQAIGLILSLQSIVLFVLIISGAAPAPEYLERFGHDDLFPSFGILGFGGWLTEVDDGSVAFRVQSFFSEANKFAAFLLIPFFLAIGDSVGFKRTLKVAILLVGIGLTFSFTAALAMIWGLMLWVTFRATSPRHGISPAIVKIIALLILISSILFLTQFFFSGESNKTGFTALDLATSKNERSVDVRLEYANDVLALMVDNPMGVAEIDVEDRVGKLPAAPIRWLVWSGIMGGVWMLILQIYLFFYVFIPSLRDGGRLEVSVATCCLTMQFMSVNHGNWSDLDYFSAIAVLLGLSKSRIGFRKLGCSDATF